MAPKVQASEMMNSHITSFLDGTAKGRSSMGGAEWPTATWPNVMLASLMMPPSKLLQLHPQDEHQIKPQSSHEVPVVRSCIHGAAPQGTIAELDHQPS